jgi:hypothetical protein
VLTVEEFRASLRNAEALDIVDLYLLGDGALHVYDDDINYILQSVAASYGVSTADVHIFVTGSAKLGFSVIEKQRKGEPPLPRYRRFSETSDIDVAVVSPPIFEAIWLELSTHFNSAVFFPPDTERLGDYLVCGWLRPDHFPKRVRLPRCDTWSDTFRRISANSRFRTRRVTGGAFNSREHLRQYLCRAVRQCINLEETP